jgi:hypothetical protein
MGEDRGQYRSVKVKIKRPPLPIKRLRNQNFIQQRRLVNHE